ncbi:HEPN domain-containing protein, partial [Gynuella sp.]|uniref:HEPN domain-containing protein n=1 Tax=Gynuella sp. TaxID=2969146 RepID=UPI003D0EF1BB
EQIGRKVTSAPLGLIVHDLEDVNNRLIQGHYFFKDIREEGIELFAATPRPLALPGNLTDAEQREIAQKHYDQWITKSKNSFIKFQFSFKESMIDEAAFDLHQVAERLYSCVLLTCSNYLPKTHNIEKLQHFCIQIDSDFTGIFPLDSKFHRRCFRRLQRAYIEARYSEHYEITEEELKYLESEVTKLKVLVERICQARLV